VIGVFKTSDTIQLAMRRAADQWFDSAEINVAHRLAPQTIRCVVGRACRISIARNGEDKPPTVWRWECIFLPSIRRQSQGADVTG
jgi:hypothetical protein